MHAIDPRVRAERAKQILDDELIKEAFRAVEAGLVNALKTSPIGDVDTHHTIALSLQLLGNVERQFRTWISDGQLETARDKQRLKLFR